MSTVSEQPEPHRRLATLAAWIGHYGLPAVAAIFLGLMVCRFLPESWAWATVPATLFLLVCLVAALILEITYHNGSLCDRCIADMPVNMAEQVEQHRRKLLFTHHMRRATPWVILFGVGIAQAFLPDLFSVVLFSLYNICLAYFYYASWIHRRLQLMCPWCRGGGDDDDPEVEPTPPPVQERKRNLA